MPRLLFLLLILCAATAAVAADGNDGGHIQVTPERILNQTAIPVYGYRIVATYPHDTSSYTEGLQMVNGTIYEGTGLYGHSAVRQWDLKTGKVLHETTLPDIYFGEGVTVLNGTLHELTYLENTGFTYDPGTLRRRGTFHYVNQGWGLTHDGAHLIMSDGSSAIQFLDPRTHRLLRRVFVTDSIGPVGFLNELEYDRGKLYANVWQTDFIAIIKPETGRITGWINLTGAEPGPAETGLPAGAERHRRQYGNRPPAGHRQMLAACVGDRSGSAVEVARSGLPFEWAPIGRSYPAALDFVVPRW